MPKLRAMALVGGDVAFGILPPHRPSRSRRRHARPGLARTLAHAFSRRLRAVTDASDAPVLPALRNYPY